MSATFPKALKKGDMIGLVSPSSINDRAVIEGGAEFLRDNGYRVVIHPQNYLQNGGGKGQLAGSDADKVAALHDLFADPAIDAVMSARGGNGALRLLDKLDYDIIRRNPKVFIGYSDTSVLLQAITAQCGFVTYHGPSASSFGRDFDPRTAEDFFGLLEGHTHKATVPGVEVLTPGRAEGVLIGGNLTMIQNLIATPYELQAQETILFIEDADEVLYRIDRMLHHFRYAGRLRAVRAVIVGDMVNVPDGETLNGGGAGKPYGYSIQDILRSHFPDIPACLQFPCGHAKYLTTLPVGARARLTLDKNGAELDFMPR
ncbi:MAG: LD-carboxypeptidase [Alphaproteobacteria bacterium]|nr:LD-carboxypeptidase [Alphaproteobacteria bacterium]